MPEESSLNAHAHDSDGRSGTITTRSGGSAGQLDTSLSVHFNVPTESKGGGEALGMGIELDLVDAARGDSEGASYGDVDVSGFSLNLGRMLTLACVQIGEKEKAESASVAAFGGPRYALSLAPVFPITAAHGHDHSKPRDIEEE